MVALWFVGPDAGEHARSRAVHHPLPDVRHRRLGRLGAAGHRRRTAGRPASVGASGAVFGLFGAILVVSKRLGGDVRGILVLIGINLALGFVMANIAWQAHVGGLVTGGLLAAAYAYAPPDRRQLVAVAAPVALGAVLLVATLLTYASIGAFSSDVPDPRPLTIAWRAGFDGLVAVPTLPTPVELHRCSYPQTCAPLGTAPVLSQVRTGGCGRRSRRRWGRRWGRSPDGEDSDVPAQGSTKAPPATVWTAPAGACVRRQRQRVVMAKPATMKREPDEQVPLVDAGDRVLRLREVRDDDPDQPEDHQPEHHGEEPGRVDLGSRRLGGRRCVRRLLARLRLRHVRCSCPAAMRPSGHGETTRVTSWSAGGRSCCDGRRIVTDSSHRDLA